MKVLLISTNTFQEPLRVFPIGIAYVSKALKVAGHEVAFLDLAWEENLGESIKRAVLTEKPDLVGVAIRNTDDYNTSPPHILLPLIRDTVDFLKEAGVSEERIVAGGTAVSNLKAPLLQYIGLKYGCIGEGEVFFVELAGRIAKGADFRDIPGLIYCEEGRFVLNKAIPLQASQIGMPDWDIYDDKYLTIPNKYGMKATLSLQSKRGCNYNCVYCAVPSIEGKKSVCRDPRQVVDEMYLLNQRFGNIPIDFLDNDFNMPREHAEAICWELIERKSQIPWTCGLHPKFITKEFLELLKKANCQRVDIGMETASNRMLRNLNRPSYSAEHLINISKWCKDLDMDLYLAGSIGGPGESYYTLKETFETVERMDLVSKNGLPTTLFYGGLRIYPGSELVKIAVQEGIIWENHPLLFPVFYFSRGLDSKAYKLVMEYKEKHPEWLFKGSAMDEWLTFQRELMERANAPAESIQIEEKSTFINKKVSGQCFVDLNDKEVRIDSYKGRQLVLLVAWQQNNEDTKKWNLALKEKYSNKNLAVQGLGSIPPLPNFLTKDFIKNQLLQVQKVIGPIWLDWDSKFIKGDLNLVLSNKTIIIGINAEGVIKFCEETNLTDQTFEAVCQKINTVLLGGVQV